MDHFGGLLSVFQEYQGCIDQFWRPPFGAADWTNLYQLLFEEFKLEPRKDLRARLARKSKLFREIMDCVKRERGNGMTSVATQDSREMLAEPSIITPKPAIGYHFKTGQWAGAGTSLFLPRWPPFRQGHLQHVADLFLR